MPQLQGKHMRLTVVESYGLDSQVLAGMDYQLPLSDMTVHIQVNLISQISGLVKYCSNSSALAMELLQYCTKPSK